MPMPASSSRTSTFTGSDHLDANEALAPNQSIVSANGTYRFTLQSDSNLVLYKEYPDGTRRPLWASNTVGRGAVTCIMQGDGNLVMYDAASHPIWASNTYGNPGSRLVAQDDGNAVIYRSNNSPSWATNTVQGPGSDHLDANEALAPNQSIVSANGIYRFTLQSDSNLVLYKRFRDGKQRPLWASNTVGRGVVTCIMQGDGNLVMYDRASHPIWASNTHGNPGSGLVAQDDGNAVIYRSNGSPSWATNTVQGPGSDHLDANEALAPNQSIVSANGIYRLTLQGDSNLVLYKRSRDGTEWPLWASNTVGRGAVTCIMQGDGNLVMYDGASHAIWASNTDGNLASRLVVQNDGNAVIYRSNDSPSWATNTVQGDTATFDSGPVTSGLPLGGSVHLVMRANGDFSVFTHAHDSGFDNIDYAISAVLITASGIAFTFQHAGHVEGTSAGLPFGTPNRNDDVTITGQNPMIAREFDGVISGARFFASLDGKDKLVGGVEGMLGDLLSQAAQALGRAAVQAVVGLVV